MTDTSDPPKSTLQQAGEDLFNYAIDREDIKWLLARLPETTPLQPAKIEYELQLLKIISVGWSIAYYLPPGTDMGALSEHYWQAANRFSQSLSETTGLMIGQNIDYFQTLKERMTAYLEVLNRNPRASEPAQVIGHEFARLCGDAKDLFAFMTGSKMFLSALQRAKQYLHAVKLLPVM